MRVARTRELLVYLLLGVVFGVVLIKSEVVSWFRIYEMFRFHSPRMYLIIGSAVVTAALSLQVIRRLHARAVDGTTISVAPKEVGRGTRYWLGGSIFGLGWGLVGACPGPLFALIGGGVSVMAVALLSALVGTAAYGMARPWLPH
jgi:uncharacterized membrane protein YedE/YeeE